MKTPTVPAMKGSQKWLQVLVNQDQNILNEKLTQFLLSDADTIKWLSPLEEKNFAEYKDAEFLEVLDITPSKITLEDFWPKSGPRWDGLAKSASGRVFLVEAKSHITELISDFKGTNIKSIAKIGVSLNETKKRFGVKDTYDWTKNFYQFANRLAHVYFLRENGVDAWLVNIYFLKDSEMDGPTTVEEWKGAIRLMHRCLGLRENLLENYVIDLFIDISTIK